MPGLVRTDQAAWWPWEPADSASLVVPAKAGIPRVTVHVDVGLFAHDDASGHTGAVELVAPAVPILRGIRLLDLSFDEAENYLSSMTRNSTGKPMEQFPLPWG
jgi:hypothetical protein